MLIPTHNSYQIVLLLSILIGLSLKLKTNKRAIEKDLLTPDNRFKSPVPLYLKISLLILRILTDIYLSVLALELCYMSFFTRVRLPHYEIKISTSYDLKNMT